MIDAQKMHAELSAVIEADMKTKLADIYTNISLVPDEEIKRRITEACVTSVESLIEGFKVEVDVDCLEVRMIRHGKS